MGDQLFQVEKIVGGPNDKSHFLIKWEGYPEDQNTWELLQHLPADMVREYLATLPGRPEYTGALGKKPANVSKQGRSKRQKKPGVDIAKEVEDDIGKEVEKDSEKHDADWVGEDEDEDKPMMLDPKRRATKEKKAAKVSKQGRSKKQKIPGVDIAKVVDDSNYKGKEPVNPPRIPKGLGRSSVVAVLGKFLIPQAPLRPHEEML